MLTIIVFSVYFIFFNWLVTRISFIKNMGLNAWWIIGLFSVKIIAGLAYAWFYLQPDYYATSDTWHYFELSTAETDWLFKDPIAFLKDIFLYGYQRSGNIFLGQNSYWNDLKSNIVIKLLAICNVFTFKNYYANIILFNFLFFFGPVALYKLMKQLFNVNRLLLLAGIFLIPSFLFWCSGIHKDGLILLCVALIVFHFQKQLQRSKAIFLSLLISIVCFVVLFALRNFMAFLLMPALLVWLLCDLYPAKSKIIISTVYGLGILLFFLLARVSSQANFPEYIIEKQAEFKQLSGNSLIEVPPLENNFLSFVEFLPVAIDIAFFRPHISEIRNKSYIPAVAEVLCLWFMTLFSLLFRPKRSASTQQTAYLFFCVCFSISFLLVAGYTITFSGAIVRYRAAVLPLLIAPVLQKFSIKKEESNFS